MKTQSFFLNTAQLYLCFSLGQTKQIIFGVVMVTKPKRWWLVDKIRFYK